MLLARRITYFWRAGASGELAPDRLSLIRSWHKHGSPPVASKSLLRVTTPLMAPLLRAGQQPSTRSGTRPPYSVPQSLFKQIWFGLLSFQRAARGWDAACVSLCIFRDQASGASLWSPQLNLEPSCFRNSPRNSTACPDFLKHYLGREVGGAVEEEGERDGRDASFFFYSRRLLRLKYIHHHNTCKGEASPVGQDICRTDTHTYTNKPVVGALLYFASCFFFLKEQKAKGEGGYSVTRMVSCSKSCSTGPLFWPLWCAAAEALKLRNAGCVSCLWARGEKKREEGKNTVR